jgi:hypothetical protein
MFVASFVMLQYSGASVPNGELLLLVRYIAFQSCYKLSRRWALEEKTVYHKPRQPEQGRSLGCAHSQSPGCCLHILVFGNTSVCTHARRNRSPWATEPCKRSNWVLGPEYGKYESSSSNDGLVPIETRTQIVIIEHNKVSTSYSGVLLCVSATVFTFCHSFYHYIYQYLTLTVYLLLSQDGEIQGKTWN